MNPPKTQVPEKGESTEPTKGTSVKIVGRHPSLPIPALLCMALGASTGFGARMTREQMREWGNSPENLAGIERGRLQEERQRRKKANRERQIRLAKEGQFLAGAAAQHRIAAKEVQS